MRELPRDLVTILRAEAKNQRTPPIDYVIAEDGGRMVHTPEPDIAMAELLEEAAAALAARDAELVAVKAALSGDAGELIDKMAEAIRDDGGHYDETPWDILSEERKEGWRSDARRALAVVKEYLTARIPASRTMTEEMADAPERIRVAQDADGFWTCREAVSGSQEYVRADLYAALEAQLAEARKALGMMLKEHDILSGNYDVACPVTGVMPPRNPDRWPTAAEAARRALEGGE